MGRRFEGLSRTRNAVNSKVEIADILKMYRRPIFVGLQSSLSFRHSVLFAVLVEPGFDSCDVLKQDIF